MRMIVILILGVFLGLQAFSQPLFKMESRKVYDYPDMDFPISVEKSANMLFYTEMRGTTMYLISINREIGDSMHSEVIKFLGSEYLDDKYMFSYQMRRENIKNIILTLSFSRRDNLIERLGISVGHRLLIFERFLTEFQDIKQH